MARRSREDTRRMIIEVALQMLHDRGPAAAVAHIRLSSVLRRAGLTTGAAYRIWRDQDDFQRELAVRALEYREGDLSALTLQAVVASDGAGRDWHDAVRVGAEVNLHPYPDHIPFLTMLAIRASAQSDPQLCAASRKRHEEATSAYSRVYRDVLARSRRRLRPGFTVRDLASALAAISEGFALQQASGLPHPRLRLDGKAEGAGDTSWPLLGVCVAAVCDRMTEPDT